MNNHISCPISHFELTLDSSSFLDSLIKQTTKTTVLLIFPFYALRESLLCVGGILSVLRLSDCFFFTMAL